MAEKMRNRPGQGEAKNSNPGNDKALNNQGFVVHKMAEAMGFELMDLLQSTVFKTVALNHSATPLYLLGTDLFSQSGLNKSVPIL